jgi:hypothetical protein
MMTQPKTPDAPEPDAPGPGAPAPTTTPPMPSSATLAESEAVVTPAPALPARRPMARATRVTLFEREVRERLSRAAMDLVFARADRLSEGQRQVRGGTDSYFGSTMLTIDLVSFAGVLRDPCDAGTARRLAALIESDSSIPRRIRDIAEREATRIAAARLKEVRTQVAVRAQGAKVFIDVDVEAEIA